MTNEGWCFFIFIMTHIIDSTINNIQQLSSLRQSHWLSTFECPTSSRSINHICTFCILLKPTVSDTFPTQLSSSNINQQYSSHLHATELTRGNISTRLSTNSRPRYSKNDVFLTREIDSWQTVLTIWICV